MRCECIFELFLEELVTIWWCAEVRRAAAAPPGRRRARLPAGPARGTLPGSFDSFRVALFVRNVRSSFRYGNYSPHRLVYIVISSPNPLLSSSSTAIVRTQPPPVPNRARESSSSSDVPQVVRGDPGWIRGFSSVEVVTGRVQLALLAELTALPVPILLSKHNELTLLQE